MVKLLGAAIVIISGGILGFYRASRERKRLEQGIELKRLLYLLQGEIRYGLTPLPDACHHSREDECRVFCFSL